MFLGKLGAAFFRQAIFLKAAVGFSGDGVFDEALCERWAEVVFPEGGAVLQADLDPQGRGCHCASSKGKNDAMNWVGDWCRDWCRLGP